MENGITGTVPYVAPEVMVWLPDRGKVLPQPFSDVWGMCCAMIEWYTGKHPWHYSGEESVEKQVTKKQEANLLPEELTNVPEAVGNLLRMGLDYDYNNIRTQT